MCFGADSLRTTLVTYIRIGKKRGTGKAIVAAAARMLHAYLMLKEKRH